MRSCDVFGVQELHVVEERLGKKMDREIAMGAQKWVNVHRYPNVSKCIAKLKQEGYQLIATTPHNNSQLIHDFDVTQKTAFFFGTESDGVSEEVMETVDGFLKIPMYGFTESLNISVSAAIILQYVVTQLKKSNVDWQLSEEEKAILKLDWSKKTIKSAAKIVERFYENRS